MRNAGSSRKVLGLAAVGFVLLATPASAHHAIGGATPSTLWEGLLSGLAHPVIGLDHLAFVVAAGLLAARHRRGVLIPIAFVAASLAATALRPLLPLLPASEWLIGFSVVLFGAILYFGRRSSPLFVALASAAGAFHGYAYGESIVGAEMTPLSAYLVGLLLVQLFIAFAARRLFLALRPVPASIRERVGA